VKKGDLVRYEYLTKHPSGVGWKFHKGIGIIVGHDTKQDSYKIMNEKGDFVERLDMQLEVITKSE
jgi:hypothetical protein